MPYYLFQGRYTPASLKALVDRPQDRAEAVRPMFEAMDSTLHHLFFCFGEEDVIALIEAPDDRTMAACALAVGASGTMAGGRTTRLMTSAEAMEAMEAAQRASAGYSPVTG